MAVRVICTVDIFLADVLWTDMILVYELGFHYL